MTYALIKESPHPRVASRTMRFDARGGRGEFLPNVFIGVPTEDGRGESVFAFDRDEFVALVKRELGLIEREIGTFHLTDADMALLGR